MAKTGKTGMARTKYEPKSLAAKGGSMKKGGGFMTTPMNKNLAK